MEKTKSNEVGWLMRQLIGKKSKKEGNDGFQYQLCMQILASRMYSSQSSADLLCVSERMKKRLLRSYYKERKTLNQNDPQSYDKELRNINMIEKFNDLHRKFIQNQVIHRKSAILSFLNCLMNFNDDNTFVKPSLKDQIFQPDDSDITGRMGDFEVKGEISPSSMECPGSSPANIAKHVPSGAIGKVPVRSAAVDISEQMLLREVLYAFQGMDTNYIFLDPTSDRFEISSNIRVSMPMRNLIRRLCELGWLYKRIDNYLTQFATDDSFGVVGQGFCSAIQAELSNYYRILAVVEAQVDVDAHILGSEQLRKSDLTLRRLSVWIQEPLDRLRFMACLVDSAYGFRGGALATCIYGHSRHGDPFVVDFIESIMHRISKPLFSIIKSWVFEGTLIDPHEEFFVCVDTSISDEDLWTEKYKLRRKMIPSFMSLELARKILVIGKSINFIRQCCEDSQWLMNSQLKELVLLAEQGKNSTSATEFSLNNWDMSPSKCVSNNFEKIIHSVAKLTNQHLTQLLLGRYKLLQHCRAIKQYLLLGQGDFIQYLMDLLGPELSKRATQIYRHNLMGVLETALNSSNAKYDSTDILNCLDVKLHKPSAGEPLYYCLYASGDDGWDVFSLHYKVSSPISTVINDWSICEYLGIFHFLWRLKRVEYSLASSWRKDMNLAHIVYGKIPELSRTMHRCHLLRSEMIHFTTNLHNYMMFEVLETSWHVLVKELEEAQDLDQLIQSHAKYLTHIKKNAFLGRESKKLLEQLKLIFNVIIKFCKIQETLYAEALREVHVRKLRQQQIESRTQKGEWGISNRYEEEYDEDCNDAGIATSKLGQKVHEIAKVFFEQIDAIAGRYNELFLQLLQILKTSSSGSPNLPFLTFRLDFNEYYQQKN